MNASFTKVEVVMLPELEFKDKKVLVVGLGESGFAAAIRLKEMDAQVTVLDSNTSLFLEKKADLLKAHGVTVNLARQLPSDLEGQQLVVVSPGVPNHLDLLEEARRRQITVWS